MFLLVGMVERRCGTGELDALGGMARGRPVLATVLITAGVIALAVPGSATFAGEFLIMAGVYGEGWGYAAVVALGIVLAAMYTLRLISAVLHVRPGSAVRDEALDLRPGELALVLPLVACLLVLSAWPALVSQSSFPSNRAEISLTTNFASQPSEVIAVADEFSDVLRLTGPCRDAIAAEFVRTAPSSRQIADTREAIATLRDLLADDSFPDTVGIAYAGGDLPCDPVVWSLRS
jgi:NADH:ubiquinone oxidoreductase subunit 5 (subunit L)/multisubunit Na+/H+ antiporter MnhA subunit